ncbi:MAG TPA: class II glutamine amidotransferase [Solirubrobacteraceae bacterium]
MCRLFGMSAGEQRARATFWLLDAPDSLSAQSHREPDGTGLGWFDERGVPRRSRQPIAAYADRQFARESHEVSSSTFVAHIRFASTGALEVRNTHPFEQRRRLFAHNGVIADLPRLEQRLGDDLALVQGDTDSERLFALISKETAAHDGDVEAGIEAACGWVARTLPLLAINLVLSTEHDLWALRYPDVHDLFVLERRPGDALDHNSSLGTRVNSDHDGQLVVVASEQLDDDAWRLLSPGELVHISRDLEVGSRVILPDPPAHQLTLADLDPRARASQAAGRPPS